MSAFVVLCAVVGLAAAAWLLWALFASAGERAERRAVAAYAAGDPEDQRNEEPPSESWPA